MSEQEQIVEQEIEQKETEEDSQLEQQQRPVNPLTERLIALSDVIENHTAANKFSNDELIVDLAYILKQRIKRNLEFSLQYPAFAPRALVTNKVAKLALNDTIREIEKKRNVLRSLSKESRRE